MSSIRGKVIDMIPNAQLEANINKLHAYLGVVNDKNGHKWEETYGVQTNIARSHGYRGRYWPG